MAFIYTLQEPPLGDEIARPTPDAEVQLTQPEALFRFAKVGGKTVYSFLLSAEV